MTPERAKILALAECLMDVPDEPTLDTMIRAILAACAEERRAALTEAIQTQRDSSEDDIYDRILALRDREPR